MNNHEASVENKFIERYRRICELTERADLDLDSIKEIEAKLKEPKSRNFEVKTPEERLKSKHSSMLDKYKSKERIEEANKYRLNGNECTKRQEWKEAIKHYSKSIELDPNEDKTYSNRALAHLKLKNYEEVVKDANRSIDINKDNLKAYQRRAEAWIELGGYRKAHKDIKLILKREPNNEHTKNTLKKLKEISNVDLDKEDTCENMIDDKIETMVEDRYSQMQGVGTLQEEDKVTYQQKDLMYEEIKQPKKKLDNDIELRNREEFYDAVNTREKMDTEESQITNRQVLEQANKIREVAEEYRKNMKQREAIISYIQALAFIEVAGDIQDEEIIYLRTIIYTGIAMCYKELEELDNTIEYATKAVFTAIHNELLTEPLMLRANVYMEKGKLEQAKGDLKRAGELQPDNVTILRTLEDLEKQLEVEKQTEVVNNIKEIQERLNEYKEEGNEYCRNKDYLKAIKEYTKGIELLLENCDAERLKQIPEMYSTIICKLYNNRAICNHLLGRQLDVIDDAGFIINKLNPEDSKAYFRRGKALRNLSSHERALDDLQKALKLDCNNENIKKELSEVLNIVIEERRKQIKVVQSSTQETITSERQVKMEEFERPTNAHTFEIVYKSCKNNPERFYQYLAECVDPNLFLSLFKHTQLETYIFEFMVTTLNQELKEYVYFNLIEVIKSWFLNT